jgi:hypothetical protein
LDRNANLFLQRVHGLWYEFQAHVPYFQFVLEDEDSDKDSTNPSTSRLPRDSKSLGLLGITPGGDPLREGAKYKLERRYMSCAMIGFDNFTWTGYAICDSDKEEELSLVRRVGKTNCFETVGVEDDAAGQDVDDETTDRDGLPPECLDYFPDPVSAGVLDANNPICDPREYFLTVLGLRMKIISRRWYMIATSMQAAIGKNVRGLGNHFHISSND